MRGINGFNWTDTELVNRMNNTMKHRGLDGGGTYTDEHVSLGHRRLAVIDLSGKAKQPITN